MSSSPDPHRHASERLAIQSPTDVRVAASVATDRCLTMGFPARASREVGIAAAELASNILRHGGGGTLELWVSPEEVRIVAVDHGPGIPDVRLALQDHYSRGRILDDPDQPPTSLGCGLGAVARLMDQVDFETAPGGGTVVRAAKRVARRTG